MHAAAGLCIINEGQILYPVYRQKGRGWLSIGTPTSSLVFPPRSLFARLPSTRREGRRAPGSASDPWNLAKQEAGGGRSQSDANWKEAGNLTGRLVTLRQGRRAGGHAMRQVWVGLAMPLAIEAPMSFSSSDLLIFARRFSLGRRPEDVGAKWSVPEEGHRARVVFGTNTAATLPLLVCPSVSFGPTSPGPQRRPGRALANTLLQQPDHFAQDFYVSTVRGN